MLYLSVFKIEIRRQKLLIYDEKVVIENCYKKYNHLFHLIEVTFCVAFTIVFIRCFFLYVKLGACFQGAIYSMYML